MGSAPPLRSGLTLKELPTLKFAGASNAQQNSTGRELFMNIKNSATAMGINRSSSLAPVNLVATSGEMPRHSSVSKPGTKQVSPRMGTLETSSIKYINNGANMQST